MTRIAIVLSSFALSFHLSAAPAVPPPFAEVFQLVRSNLQGVAATELDRAAVEGFLQELNGRVVLVKSDVPAPTNAPSPVTQTEVFDGKVGYARIAGVTPELAAALASAVAKLDASNQLCGLVLDLRYAGGGDYAAAVAGVDCFLGKEVPLLNAGHGLLRATDKTNEIRLPVVALINGQTKAAAEAVAAMLRQAGVGLLVGSRTAGQASVMRGFTLSTGQSLQVAVAPVQLGDAKAISTNGVAPDIDVAVSADEEKAYYADPYTPIASATAANGGSTNLSATAHVPKRTRVTEADLVREKHGDPGSDEAAAPKRIEPETPQIQDPALARAIDLLKGLALVRQWRN
jgi:hypothetical protein